MAKLLGQFVSLFLYMKCIIICWSSMSFASNVQGAAGCRRSDMDALMSLKNGFLDPDNRLSSWKGSSCCEWPGIRCDNISLSVIAVDLCRYGLSGYISASLTKLNKSLTYLDLSFNDFNYYPIPEFFGSLSKLRYLNLSRARFGGMITPQLGNLSNLEYIDLSASFQDSLNLAVGSLEWLTGFGTLKYLAFNYIDMSAIGSNWLEDLNKVSQLKELHMSYCGLTGSISSISSVNFTSISLIDLSHNKLLSKFPDWILNISNLKSLFLARNSFQGPIPSSLGALGGLESLDLSMNNLNGTVPVTIGQLSELHELRLSSNQLSGLITEAHFRRMSKLFSLDLSSNSLTFDVGLNWVPPFQLSHLSVRSCQLGTFPTWLKSQKQITWLDLSNNSISGYVPSWFWDDMAPNLSQLNISVNHLRGNLPNPLSLYVSAYIDLSSNLFNGPIPLLNDEMSGLYLSHNRFTGPIPPTIGEKQTGMRILSLSNNFLTGEIPTSIGLMSYLYILDLSNNNLSGTIPSNILVDSSRLMILDISSNSLSGYIPSTVWHSKTLIFMHLNNNLLSGFIPTVIRNISYLDTVDLSHNVLSDTIPSWLLQGLTNIRILSLRSNYFYGNIPLTISKLRSLRVLALAENKLTGNIPSSLGNLLDPRYHRFVNYKGGTGHQESLTINVKFIGLKYTRTVYIPSNIDLSSNRFSGPFPEGITNLSALQVLNLSRNEIQGHIPESISQMRALESLDFSNNKLSGPIPSSITSLTLLGAFDVSNNNLSGTIPVIGQLSTFNKSSFEGNTGLCSPQLNISCADAYNRRPTIEPNNKDEVDHDENGYIYMSMGVGFVVGIILPIILL